MTTGPKVLLLEALSDYMTELSDKIVADGPQETFREHALYPEYERARAFFDALDEDAPLCMEQDPDTDFMSWKCQLWDGHRETYHSYA